MALMDRWYCLAEVSTEDRVDGRIRVIHVLRGLFLFRKTTENTEHTDHLVGLTSRTRSVIAFGALAILASGTRLAAADDKPAEPAVIVDKEKKSVTIACKIAPRKLPNLTEVYPIEVIATLPSPQGKKAHETVVTFSAKPSEIHAALASLGLKPGKPALGEDAAATGPELKISLEVSGPDGKPKVLPIEKTLVDRKTGKPLPALKWIFTGSVIKDVPGQSEKVYAADTSGTLIAIFPVTDETVIQTNLTMKEEPLLKLETNPKVLPAEGLAAKLVIEVK